ncbi:hypothetical protein C0993_003153, partial [Termitomyces sp. T159_Od127]
MQLDMSRSPSSPGSNTVLYDDAERGDGDGIAFMQRTDSNHAPSSNNTAELSHGNPTFYGPIPVYENRFGEPVNGRAELQASDIGEQIVEFFDGLDDKTIASLACDHTSNFDGSPDPSCDALAPVEGDEVQPHSLLEDFYKAG